MTESDYGITRNPQAPKEKALQYPVGYASKLVKVQSLPAPKKNFKNLTERLEHELPRPANQKVIVKKISDHFFRVNWFAPITRNETGDMAVKGWRIAASQFLRVTEKDGLLVMDNQTKH